MGVIEYLKVNFRSKICPFDDLLEIANQHIYKSIMDIGCGRGQFLLLLSKLDSSEKLYGVEVSQELVSDANNLLSQCSDKFVQIMEFNGLDFPDELNECNLVLLIDVLHHVPKNLQLEFLKNIYASMSSGSTLVIKDIDASSNFVYFNKLHDLIFSGSMGNELSFETTIGLLRNNGFNIRSIKKRRMYVYPHYTIVAQK